MADARDSTAESRDHFVIAAGGYGLRGAAICRCPPAGHPPGGSPRAHQFHMISRELKQPHIHRTPCNQPERYGLRIARTLSEASRRDMFSAIVRTKGVL